TFCWTSTHPLEPLREVIRHRSAYRTVSAALKALLTVPLLALTLLLLSGIHPEAHDHDLQHAEHCDHGHEHDHGDEEHSAEHSSHTEQHTPICACACHFVVADRSDAQMPVVEEL